MWYDAMTLRCTCPRASSVQRSVVSSANDYCPTVKSSLYSTVPAASFTSTCQAPVHSAGTALRLQVRQGDPPTCSSTSPTCVSPWNHTWWMLAPPAPSTLVQQLSWPTSAGNAAPVSCGCRSSTDRATTASTTVTDGVAAAGAAALLVSCAASPRPRSRADAAIIAMRFMTALLQKVSLVRRAGGDVPATCPASPRS